MQKKLEELNKLVSEIQKREVKLVVDSIKNKLGLLKTCYDKSDNHIREKIHELIKYRQLRCYLTGELYTNSSSKKKIQLKDIAYTDRAIKLHIKNGLPTETNWQPIDIYSFHFGGYKEFFRCFGKGFLKDKMKLDPFFVEDIYSESKSEIIEVTYESKPQISGATIINEKFINSVKSGKAFTMPEFYGAKQNNNCQWYGIINDFDIIRNGYEELKEVVINSFLEEKDGKVTAIVHGTGGSGKSTVLRRLAIDFHAESFDVIWLEKGEVEEFVEKGLASIKNEIEKYENRKFLIVIEDWCRMFDDEQKVKLGSKILEETFNMNNTRLVIADRDNNKQYRNYRNNKFELHLSSQDNKEIIEKIIEKYPDWKMSSEKIFEIKQSYEPTLFLLLFILARINLKEFNNNFINLSETQMIFQNIIESDLNYIEKKSEGLAKALYYWGCLYSEHKIFISYKTFFKIADYFEETNKISNFYKTWDYSDDVLKKISIYLGIKPSYNHFIKIEEDYIFFHHDSLSELGLSKVEVSQKWSSYSSTIKFQILSVLVKFEDTYNLQFTISKIINKQKEIDKKQLFEILKQLIRYKKITKTLYSLLSKKIKFSKHDYDYYALKFWKNQILIDVFWVDYFKSNLNRDNRDKYIDLFLNLDDVNKYPDQIIKVALQCADKDKKKIFFDEILKSENIRNTRFREEIVCLAITPDYADMHQNFIRLFLKNALLVPTEKIKVLEECLINSKDKETNQKMIEIILLNNISEYNERGLQSKCISLNKDELIFRKLTNKLIENNNWKNKIEILYTLLLNYKNVSFAEFLLQNWQELPSHITEIILKNYNLSFDILQSFYKDVLKTTEKKEISLSLHLIALRCIKDDVFKKTHINIFFKLAHWSEYDIELFETYLHESGISHLNWKQLNNYWRTGNINI